MAEISLKVDLADLEDIRAKLPQAEEILEQKRREVRVAENEADRWESLVGKLRAFSVVRFDDSERSAGRPTPAQDLVVHVINREDRLMRPVEVAKVLESEGHEITSPAAVNAALYAATDAGRIRRPKARYYGPVKKA